MNMSSSPVSLTGGKYVFFPFSFFPQNDQMRGFFPFLPISSVKSLMSTGNRRCYVEYLTRGHKTVWITKETGELYMLRRGTSVLNLYTFQNVKSGFFFVTIYSKQVLSSPLDNVNVVGTFADVMLLVLGEVGCFFFCLFLEVISKLFPII